MPPASSSSSQPIGTPSKKSRVIWIVAFVIIVLVAIIVGAWFFRDRIEHQESFEAWYAQQQQAQIVDTAQFLNTRNNPPSEAELKAMADFLNSSKNTSIQQSSLDDSSNYLDTVEERNKQQAWQDFKKSN